MSKAILLFILFQLFLAIDGRAQELITRQGAISFFSYTSVENIEATNNQVLSIIDLSNNEIAITILMKAFSFEKSLMQEHFNESYIESDIYPKATFVGKFKDLETFPEGESSALVEGTFTIHGVSKEDSIVVDITKRGNSVTLIGKCDLLVKDFDIRIPPILASNIAEIIAVKFSFEYEQNK